MTKPFYGSPKHKVLEWLERQKIGKTFRTKEAKKVCGILNDQETNSALINIEKSGFVKKEYRLEGKMKIIIWEKIKQIDWTKIV